MTEPLERFRAEYAAAFRSYLFGAGETGLEAAYELGRTAVTGQLSLLELAGIHHSVLAEALGGASTGDEVARLSSAGADFFLESLATFEMTQRGFLEAQETAAIQRGIAETLQRKLLPPRLPEIPGFVAAARYLAGGDGVEVGGDWYDVIPLSGHRVGVAIGDVVGRGVGAASIMGQLRVALRAYALEAEAPALVAQRLAGFVQTLDEDQMATCAYLVLESGTGTLRLANAGHPPPLLLRPDGTASYLEGDVSPPFGIRPDEGYVEVAATLEPGSAVLLYTDGLVEERGAPIDEGLERLRAVVSGAPLEPDSLCDRVLAALVEETPGDDIALLAVRSLPVASEPLRVTFPAEPAVLASLRRTLTAWLQEAGASAMDSYDIALATCEAAANAVEHAYGAGEDVFELHAEAVEGEVTVTIRDFGRWRPSREGTRGRGLGVMRSVMDAVEVTSRPDGTTVRLQRRLPRGAPVGSARAD